MVFVLCCADVGSPTHEPRSDAKRQRNTITACAGHNTICPLPPQPLNKFRSAGARDRPLATRLGLVVIGGLVGLLLAEILLRLLGVAYPLPYYPDPYCGSRLRPGFQGWFTKEGRAFVTINSAGFRDREHPLVKPPDTIRIAVLGDSFAEAVQVPLEQTSGRCWKVNSSTGTSLVRGRSRC